MRVLERGVVACLVLFGVVAADAYAAKVRFSGPPTIADRKISWSWEPLAGADPYFQGNTVLSELDATPAPVPPSIRLLRSNSDGSRLYGVGSDNRIYIWNAGSSTAETVLAAPPDSLLDIDVHLSGTLILGGLRDGRVAYWDLRNGIAPTLFTGQRSACRFVRFLVQTANVEDRRLLTAGDEDTVRVWDSPGAPVRAIYNSGFLVNSLAVTVNGAFLAVGDPIGSIRIFQPLISGSIQQRLEGHQGGLKSMVFSTDRKRLASVDAQGKLIVWSTARWSKVFEFQLERPEGATLGMRDPDGVLIYTLDRTGFFQILDGNDGRVYRAADLAEVENLRAGIFADLGRTIFVPTEDGVIHRFLTGFCTPSATEAACFGGYMIWRSPTPRSDDAILMRVFGFGDSTWTFAGARREFTDPDSLIPRSSHSEEPLAGPHNGLPYYYSITPFERKYEGGSVFDALLNTIDEGFYRADSLGDPTPVAAHAPAREDTPYLARIIVVPNPYEAGKVPWDQEAGEHIEFRNLPSRATIRIYTMAGEQVRTIQHGPGDFGESTDTRRWDLRNDRGEKVTSGVYLYHVTTALNGESMTGYLCLVR
jgi:hypothetical protein